MEFSVRTGSPAFEHVFGAPVFDWYADHPEDARIGAAGLTSRSRPENAAVLAAYDFSDVLMLVDPGGRERTVAEHSRLLEAAGLRLTRTIPTSADVTILESVPS